MQKYKYISINDKNYPIYLKTIHDPPKGLYYYGHIDEVDFTASLSIVGSRNATPYGQACVDWIVKGLKGQIAYIISGFALGIDALVHKACIKYGIRTIAVMPLGIDVITPVSNTALYFNILRNHGIIMAEDKFIDKYNKFYFPRRNRIIAGLSMKTIVIEAAAKSGAVITADFAFNENRQVYAIPGRIDMEYSYGTNDLIKINKAELLNDISQIINN